MHSIIKDYFKQDSNILDNLYKKTDIEDVSRSAPAFAVKRCSGAHSRDMGEHDRSPVSLLSPTHAPDQIQKKQMSMRLCV